MQVILYLAPLVALIGLIMYLAIRSNGEVKQVGLIMFGVGLLASLILWGGHIVAAGGVH